MSSKKPGWFSRLFSRAVTKRSPTKRSPTKRSPTKYKPPTTAERHEVEDQINRNAKTKKAFIHHRKIQGALHPRTYANRLRRLYYGVKRIFNWKPIATRAENAEQEWKRSDRKFTKSANYNPRSVITSNITKIKYRNK